MKKRMEMKNVIWILIIIMVVSCFKSPEQKNKAMAIETAETETTEKKYTDQKINPTQNVSDIPNAFDMPTEFIGKNWNSNFGNLSPVENFTLNDLQSCSWQRNDTILIFSHEGHYARMSRDGNNYGHYSLEDNTIFFFPPLNIVRFAEEYAIISLHYSNEMYYEGTPALRNDDETIIFTANDSKKAIVGEIVKIHQHYCEKIWEKGKIITNGVLFSLPDITSKNIFQGDYYGRKATETAIVKLAKTTINNIVWYYILFDFSSEEPSDGGGPFYNGWLPEEYFE